MTPSQGEATEDVGMAVLALASAKGGVGKTTIAVLVGTGLALEGYKVTLLDCDLNQHATAFGEKVGIRGFTVVPSIDEANVLSALRRAETDNDIVLIDLPGGSSTLALKALQRSHLVLVPSQASLPDVRDAMKTVAQINDAQELARAPIARAVVWTRLLPGFESKSARHVRTSLEGQGGEILRTALMERAAFREMHITGVVPRQSSPTSTAAINVEALANEVLGRLQKLAEP